MNFSIDPKYVIGAVAAVLVILATLAIRRWQLMEASPFDVQDLFLENGKASRGAVVLLGAFAVTTWMFVYYAWTGKMTEGYFQAYCLAWVAPIIARVIFPEKPSSVPQA